MNKLRQGFQKRNEGPLSRGAFRLAVVLMILVAVMAIFYILFLNIYLGIFFLLFDAWILWMVSKRLPE